MPFSGNVETIPLDEVFQFVSTNSLEGSLVIAGGGARLTIYFENGLMFFPFSAKRGTYSLGKILRQTGVLSREALEKQLESAKRNRLAELKALEAQANPEQLEAARRKQFEEEIHDAFLWRRAYFEFTPGEMPTDVQRERATGKGVSLGCTTFLMEVARRADERRRIRSSIPTARAILQVKPGAEEKVVAELTARKIDVTRNPFDGSRSLEELVEQWGMPQHDSLGAVAPLVETGTISPISLELAQARYEAALRQGDGKAAARFLAHVLELGPPPARPFELGLEKALFHSKVFSSFATSGEEVTFSSRVTGPRAFAIVRELVAAKVPFTVTAREDGREKRLALSDQQLSLHASADDVTSSIGRYLRRANAITEADLKAATAAAEEQRSTVAQVLIAAGKIGEEDWLGCALEKVSDEIAELVLWRDVDIEVRNRSRAFTGKAEPAALALAIPVATAQRSRLQTALEAWAQIAESVPGEDALYVLGDKAREGDPAAKFFSRFDGKRTIGELRRVAKAEPLEFVRFVHAGLKRGYARPPTRAELEERLAEANERQDDVRAFKLARAGVAFGFGAKFLEQLAALKKRDAAPSPDSRPSIEGDMNGLGLAAVLQGLRGRKRTGTLNLTDGKRETKLYFHRGAIFLLRIEDAAAQEFVNFFLDGEEANLDFVAPTLEQQKGQVQETDLDAADARRLKDEVLDVLFWDNARFAFSKNDLPEEFFNPGPNTTKVALNTDSFLMEAIGRIQEWDHVRQAIPSGACRLAFVSSEAKFETIRSHPMADVMTLIDGRKTFEDVIRISGQARLDVGKALTSLVEGGQLQVLEPEAATASSS